MTAPCDLTPFDAWEPPTTACVAVPRPSVIEPCTCAAGGWLVRLTCAALSAEQGKPDTMGPLYGWMEET